MALHRVGPFPVGSKLREGVVYGHELFCAGQSNRKAFRTPVQVGRNVKYLLTSSLHRV